MAWLRRETFVRPSATVVAIAVVAAIAAAAVWGLLFGNAASRRLLTPIIEYHAAQYKINHDRWQWDLDAASKQMDRTRTSFDGLRQATDRALNPRERPGYIRADPWAFVQPGTRGLVADIGQVGQKLRDAGLHEKMTIYHSHMRSYYEGLLRDGVAWLPPVPESLEVERKMLQLDLERRYGASRWDESEEPTLLRKYESEPPPHLARRAGAPMPKPRDGTAAAPRTR